MVNFQDTGVWILKKKIMDPVCPERLDPDPNPAEVRWQVFQLAINAQPGSGTQLATGCAELEKQQLIATPLHSITGFALIIVHW